MRKTLISVICLLALLIGILAFGVSAAELQEAAIDGVPCATLEIALNDALVGQTVTLLVDIAEEITVPDKAITIDLNGHNMGAVTVVGTNVSFMDSQTADHDNVYGAIAALNGTANAAAGYIKATDGAVSFHKVDLEITAMSLRASEAGVYYKSNFQVDEVAAKYIDKYGVALSVKGEPNETNSTFSTFTNFNGKATGTLLKNIMNPSASDANNNRNANMAIYGRPYVLTTDGQYIFGETVQRSLKQQLEAIDANWTSYSEASQKTVFRMLKNFKGAMDSWNISTIKREADPGSDGILKVLIVGNSHGLDSTNLLCEVLKDQGLKPEEFVVGALYKSGCNMGEHANFVTNNTGYETYNENGGPNDTNGVAWEVIKNPASTLPFDRHQWDIVIMQQMNHRAGINEYVKSQFLTVLNFIDDHQIGSPKMGWHMIWANPDNYETYLNDNAPLKNPNPSSWRTQHEAWYGDENGTYKSINMYNKVVACTQKYITDSTEFLGKDYFDFVIPAATTIQYARDVLGYTEAQLYRDYTHISDFGRLMSAYTWYGKIVECVDGVLPTVTVNMTEFPAVLHVNKSTYPAATDGKYYIDQTMRENIATAVNWALANPYTLPVA